MDPELEEQLNSVFEKTLSELKTKIGKIVTRHEKKVVKDASKKAKDKVTSSRSTKKKPVTKRKVPTKSSLKSSRHYSEDEEDSDEYSE